jgi:hypothetical protein
MNNYTIIYNGLTIGAGTSFPITNIDGLGGTSPLRIQDENRGYIDGSYSGRDFYDERTVYIDVTVLGDNSNTAQANYLSLQQAFAPQPLGYYPDPTGYTPSANQLKLFQFRLSANTGDQQMYGRSRGLNTPVDPNFSYGYIQTRIMMSFPDPRYYSNTGTTVYGSNVAATNSGWATMCPVITVSSPATSGYIKDVANGIQMDFANTGGNPLIIDLLQRVVYLSGIPVRNVMLASSTGWLSIPPTSSVYWQSSIGSFSTTYRNAYV